MIRDTRLEPRTPIVVTIDYVRLEDLAVGGSDSIGARSMKATQLDASVGGSGSIELIDLDVAASASPSAAAAPSALTGVRAAVGQHRRQRSLRR